MRVPTTRVPLASESRSCPWRTFWKIRPPLDHLTPGGLLLVEDDDVGPDRVARAVRGHDVLLERRRGDEEQLPDDLGGDEVAARPGPTRSPALGRAFSFGALSFFALAGVSMMSGSAAFFLLLSFGISLGLLSLGPSTLHQGR
jgi:hypothetical protein